MTPELQAKPANFLSEDFTPEDLHPVDITDILEYAFEEYEVVDKRLRKQYRDKYNTLVDVLAQKRNFRQFNYLK